MYDCNTLYNIHIGIGMNSNSTFWNIYNKYNNESNQKIYNNSQ